MSKSIFKRVTDGFENIVTGLGRSQDKREGGRIRAAADNLSEQQWLDLYSGDDVAASIAEIPAREMVRKGFAFNAAEQPDLTEYVNNRLEELRVKQHLYKALLWSRVFGAGVTMIATDELEGFDGMQTPLPDGGMIEKLVTFNRWSFHFSNQDGNPLSDTYGRGTDLSFINHAGGVTGTKLDMSRMMLVETVDTPLQRIIRNGGWADSVFIRLSEVIRDYGLAWGTVGNLVQDFSQMVYKIKDLAEMLASDNDGLVTDRLATMDMCRSSLRAIPLDADSEDAMRISTPITGLPDLLQGYSLRLSAGTRIPVTLLMGQSPAGLNATGASDIRLFYDWISSMQEAYLLPHLETLCKYIINEPESPQRQEPDDWCVEFERLWQLDDKDQAEVDKKESETAKTYFDIGALDEPEIRESIKDKYPLQEVRPEPEPEPELPVMIPPPIAQPVPPETDDE